MPENGPALPIVVRGTITPADSMRAWRYAQQRRFAFVRGIALLTGALFVAASAGTGRLQLVILLAGLIVAAMPAWASSMVRRELRKDRRLHSPHVLTFGEDGIRAERGRTGDHRPWTVFDGFEESPHDLILRFGKMIVSFPKRLFEPAQLAGVRTLIAAKVPGSGRAQEPAG